MKLLKRSTCSRGRTVNDNNTMPPATKRRDGLQFDLNWSSPSEEDRDALSTQRTKHRGVDAGVSGPLHCLAVTPCRLPNAATTTTPSAMSASTAMTAAITPMTPSPFKSPSNLQELDDFDCKPSIPVDAVSTQPGTAPTTAPGPRGTHFSPDQPVTFCQLQRESQSHFSSSNKQRYITSTIQSGAIHLDSKQGELFPSETLSPATTSRKRRSRASMGTASSSRRSRLQESLLLIDDPPTREPRRRSALSSSLNSFSNYSFELSSSSADISPSSSTSSDPAPGRASSSSSTQSPGHLRRRSSHFPMLSLPDDGRDCCFDESNKKSSKSFSKRGSATVLYTLCLAAVMTSLGMIVYTKFVPFQQFGSSQLSSQQLALYYPPTRPNQRPDLHQSASGLRGKMVQSGAGRIVATIDQNSNGSTKTKSGKHKTHSNNKKHQKDRPSASTSHKTSSSKFFNTKTKHASAHESKKMEASSHHETKDKKSTLHSRSTEKKSPTKPRKASHNREAQLKFHMPDKDFPAPSGNRWATTDPSLYIISGSSQKDRKQHSQPRVFALDKLFGDKSQAGRTVQQYPSDFTDNTQLYPILDSDDERLSRMELREPYSDGECVPMQEWQTTFHPSCNGMHELSIENSVRNDSEDDGGEVRLFGTKGYWRNAWRLDLLQGSSRHEERDTVVLKTLKFEHNYEDDYFEHNRVDAVAMERLTSSQHVINLFGFCGHSVLTEFADGSRVGELADKARKRPLARLKIASDIAHGLADVHGIDGDGNATFVHLDVNPANVVSIGGTLKLNDFNIGIIRRWNTTSNTPCGFPAQYPNPQWRSPEEARNEQDLTEKVDVFSMGHIFFRLICGHEPWNKLEPGGRPSKDAVNEKVKRGEMPFIPEFIRESKDPEVIAIRTAMMKCYTFNPVERPSARSIAEELDSTLLALSKVTK